MARLLGVNFEKAVVSQDGKLLFTTGGIEQVFRFRLEGAEVKFEEASPRIIQGRFEGLCVSPDGQFICAPCGGGNYQLEGEKRQPYSTAIYFTSSFKAPLLRLASGAYPMAVGFDPKSGLLYAQNGQSQLIVFNADGTKLKEYTLGKGGMGSTRQFLVHTDGRKMLVLGEGGGDVKPAALWHVELPTK
jgi:hypothetical protein